MFKRLGILVGLILVLALALAMTATTVSADDPDGPGAKTFSTYCAGCHGAAGKGGFAPAIGSESYLASKDDAWITQWTTDGKVSGGMPAWGKANGGSLTDDQIQEVVAYLRSLAPAAQVAPTPATTAQVAPVQVAPVQAPVNTVLTVAQSANAQGSLVLNATLKDANGKPVSGASIAFGRPTVYGVVDMGTAKTNAAGSATLLVPVLPNEARQVVATYKGGKGAATTGESWNASESKITLDSALIAGTLGDTSRVMLDINEPLLAPEGSLITPNPPLVPTTIFLLVVGGIWSMYLFVMYQLVQISRGRKQAPRANVLRMKGR